MVSSSMAFPKDLALTTGQTALFTGEISNKDSEMVMEYGVKLRVDNTTKDTTCLTGNMDMVYTIGQMDTHTKVISLTIREVVRDSFTITTSWFTVGFG